MGKRLVLLNEAPAPAPPMRDSTRARLNDAFAPHNEALAGLLGRPLPDWGAA